jgi:hypothetical protein
MGASLAVLKDNTDRAGAIEAKQQSRDRRSQT